MVETFKKMATQLTEMWRNMSKSTRWKVILIASLLLVVAIGSAFFLNRKEYVVLYSNLDSKDAGEILNKLTEMKVDAKPQGMGTILVPKDQETRIRMELSSQGYPKSGLNYDLFMNQSGFGTTDFEKQKYLLFQLQDRLQNTIKTLEGVEDAIVTISMPEADSFVLQENKEPATASVLLKLASGVELAPKQVKGIQELVLKSVMGLTPENISIIDSNMNVLSNQEGDEGSQIADTQLELENKVGRQIEQRILSVLEPVFGYKKVVAAANVKLDFDKKVEESIKYEPVTDDEGIAVSINELKEKVTNSAGGEGGVPGTTSNGGSTQYPASQQVTGDYEKTNRVTNYQVNQVKEQLEKAQGQIKDLSVSVVIDNNKMTTETMENVREIVASAVGIDPTRVVVQSMEFNGNKQLQEQLEEAFDSQHKSPSLPGVIQKLLLYGGMGLLGILMVILVRAMTRRRKVEEVSVGFDLESIPSVDIIPDIEINDSEASIQSKVEKFTQQQPEVVAQLLRTWLNEE